MNKGKILAGLDAGHVNTKAIIMRGQEILGWQADQAPRSGTR